MNIKEAQELFGIQNEHEKVFFAQIPRCVILDRSIPMAAKNVYYYLIARCDQRQGPFTWVTQQTIADDMGIARKNINANIKTLEKFGLIEIKKTADKNRNVYLIKNVAAIYGEYASAPWTKKIQSDSCNEIVTGVVTKSLQPVVPKSLQPVVTKSLHKEEEGKEQEIQGSEKKKKNPKPSVGVSAISSALAEMKKPPKYETQDLALAVRWVDFAKGETKGSSYPSWTPENFAKDLAKLRIKAGLNHEAMAEVLEFVLEDKFWRPNAISPAGLLTKSSNGLLKINNLLSAMKGAPKYKTARDFEKVKDLEYDPTKVAF